MTDRAPIPAARFEDAVDRLDRDEFAAFVGRLEAAGGGSIEVDPPVVTVGDGDGRERILVADDPGSVPADGSDPPVDAVVVPEGATAVDYDGPVRTPADLRQQLLYAVSPEDAESIAEDVLGLPARSASYEPDPTPAAATGGDADAEGNSDTATSDGRAASAPAGRTATASGGSAAGTPTDPGGHSTPTDEVGTAAAATRSGAGIVVVGVLVAVILAVTGGVVYAAEVAPGGDAGAFAAPVPIEEGGLSDAETRSGSQGQSDEGGPAATATATPMPGEGDGSGGRPATADTEATRNVRPVPTCERSFLHVVQIQMNALRYNNNTTNDGIRTVRRFSSPSNRRTISTFAEFVRIVKSPTYSPLLSYESVRYTPIQSSDDFAQVQVLTREDGNVTGQYYFRLRKIDGGEYDGCWMTDAVVLIPETNSFSGKVGGRSTNSVNATS